jgi:alpha-amylase/alpha-mannosidase (GH57 family)
MPNIYVCFVWHMHQPFYKDLVSGQYKLPWTRMHALKDYYGMVKILEDFPSVHQTFNLVPSMLMQIEEYTSGKASDPFLQAALKPSEYLEEHDRRFILQYFFQANPARIIYRYPRYRELYDAWLAVGSDVNRARRMFSTQDFRDLQVLSQLAWFDEEFLAKDPEVMELVRKVRGFSYEDQLLVERKELEILAKVIPVYGEFARRGQIELTTTPFYHPILPLICDTQIAEIAHPYVPLPSRFRYPEDARHQLERACRYMQNKFGAGPTGLWPSEGSVSDEALRLAADAGFRWFASDNGVLARTQGAQAEPFVSYRPYVWRHDGRELKCIFRDHYLSDLIGFVYSRMEAVPAAEDFLSRIRANCKTLLASGCDALVPIILDGENAWEYYEQNGRPFLRELYRRIQDDPGMTTVTGSEAFARIDAEPLNHIHPGSWINANFDIWIGGEEDNKAWEYLLKARQTFERIITSREGADISQDRKELAYEELLIAEGSDWCWWYGPEHDSANRAEFDQLFRDHLANVYLALRQSPPEELSRPILRVAVTAYHQPPKGPVKATIDGEVTSNFEWLSAGVYRVDNRSGAMHGQRMFVQELRYGSDGQNLYIRIDFVEGGIVSINGTELRVTLQPAGDGATAKTFSVYASRDSEPVQSVAGKIWELKIPLTAVLLSHSRSVQFQVSLWVGGLPMDALPPQGWIEMSPTEPGDWMI